MPCKPHKLLLFLFLFALPWSAYAADETEPFASWLQALRQEAKAKGISEPTLQAALTDIQPIERVIELDRRQPEFTQTFLNYLNARVTPERIARGREMLRKHHTLLAQEYQKYHVPPRYLVAFWGLETNFGSYLGAFPVVNALATLAYDERRSDFFRRELLDALLIIDQGHVSVTDMKGSWAGAIGNLQFLPSTFLKYSVDANGDGKNDVWHTVADVIQSGGNYLQQLGWQPEQLWGREVRLPAQFDWHQARLEVKKTVAEWSALGVTRANGTPLPKAELEGAIVLPQGNKGPAFLVYDNFEVILRWNRSISYAIAVGYLADRMIGLPPLRNGLNVDNRPLSRDQVMQLQQALQQQGIYQGPLDGIIGSQTRTAIRGYQTRAGLPVDGYASLPLLQQLIATPLTQQ
jgi:membrane-bound lytic murein transglycosylase B